MTRILQFGTSRFLQAHVDLFVHEARESGQDVGPVTVVKTTPAADRAGRVRAFGAGDGYPVVLRGLVDGAPVERTVTVRSVDRGLSAHQDWPELIRLFALDADIVVSNTGDTGFAISAQDRRRPRAGEVPSGFPAKLLALLVARHMAGGRAITMLPCELVSGNGRALRQALTGLARDWSLPDAFMAWLVGGVVIADTLVDRIVSEPIEPIGAIAEPYALWAIQRCPGLAPPLEHPDVVITDALEPYERLKLHILNLGHTVLAELWLEQRRAEHETVREMLGDGVVLDWLERLYADEVVPGFAERGMADAAGRYVATTMQRFANPFLDHRVADIAQHHATKVKRRIGAFLDWTGRRDASPILTRLVETIALVGS